MEKLNVHIVGVHLNDAGYPNVHFKIQELEESASFQVNEFNRSMWLKVGSRNSGFVNKFKGGMRAIASHAKVLLYLFRHTPNKMVYVPYPCVFLAYGVSFFPKSRKPKLLMLDAFISLYDTVVCDRKLLAPSSLVAKLLKHMERRAYQEATKVITDTAQNASYVSNLFSLPSDKFIDIHLSTDEKHFIPMSFKARRASYNLLFIGTLVPLHGVELILEAADRLLHRKDIHFTLIGDGQTSHLVENHFWKGEDNVSWIRDWKTSEELAVYINDADICLGIFGDGNKTQRVCPYKIYAYCACGKPIITRKTTWSGDCKSKLSYEPFIDVGRSSDELVSAITSLLNSDKEREQLAKNSARFYQENLSNEQALQQLHQEMHSLLNNS